MLPRDGRLDRWGLEVADPMHSLAVGVEEGVDVEVAEQECRQFRRGGRGRRLPCDRQGEGIDSGPKNTGITRTFDKTRQGPRLGALSCFV